MSDMLSCLCLPFGYQRLLLPASMVVALHHYAPVEPPPSMAPEWLLGHYHQEGQQVAVVALEWLTGQPGVELGLQQQLAVVRALSAQAPLLAFRLSAVPTACRLAAADVQWLADDALPIGIAARVRLPDGEALIPDGDALWRKLAPGVAMLQISS